MTAKPLVVVVLGTRPEAIKLAPVVRALKKSRSIDCRVLSTGQHRAMLRQALDAVGLRLWRDLLLMRPDQSPGEFSRRAFSGVLAVLRKERPALVVVQGDTTTALSGALAAYHEEIPVAHVEAGLRSGDLSCPFPEEANRIIIDDLSTLLFAPTREAARALRRLPGRVFVTGNTIVDAVRGVSRRPRRPRSPALSRALARARPDDALILATMHRRESFDGGIAAACAAMRELLERRPRARLLFPMHLNPRVRRAVVSRLRHPRAALLEPLDYPDFIAVLERCRFVLTDSGGVQEEAAVLGKPTLVLRRVTDRPEAVRAGAAEVVGLSPRVIVARAERLIDDEKAYRRMARRVGVFGDGRAGGRIAREIGRFLASSSEGARRLHRPNL